MTERTERLPHNPNTPGKVQGDHAGHSAGDRFGGSPNIDNLVSQLQNVNLSQYKKIENAWERSLKRGQTVTVDVDLVYSGNGLRPVGFDVGYTIDGESFSIFILNY